MSESETAYAKINLALHVRCRRPDGYHEIETLFAFVDDGDRLSIEPAERDSLTITGEFAAGLSTGPDNLVWRALAHMRDIAAAMAVASTIPPLAIRLDKRLPVAAGIGGGSADAAAMIRLLRRFVPGADADALIRSSAALGADVGACIVSETRIGTGLGWELQPPSENDVSGMHVLLLNPRIPVPTGQVFAGWDGVDRGPLPAGTAREIAQAGRNDLEQPALRHCPPIATMLDLLNATGARLSRMSGSGATCFGLYKDELDLRIAQDHIRETWGDWWQLAGRLR